MKMKCNLWVQFVSNIYRPVPIKAGSVHCVNPYEQNFCSLSQNLEHKRRLLQN